MAAKKTINTIWGSLTANKQTFSEQEIGDGIVYKGPIVSNQLNGIASDVYQMIDFEQRTGGFYNPSKKYKTDNIVTILREDTGIGKRIEYFRCKIGEGDEIVGEHPYIGGQYDDSKDIPIMKGGVVNTDKWERMNFEVKKDLKSIEIVNPLDGSWERMGYGESVQGDCSILKIWEVPKPQGSAVDPLDGKKIYGKYKVEIWYEENLYVDGLKNNNFSAEYFGDDAVHKCEFDIEFSGKWRRRVNKDDSTIDAVQEPGFGPFAPYLNNFTSTQENYAWSYPDAWVSNVVAWRMSKPRGRALIAWSEYNWNGTPRKCDSTEPPRMIDTQILSTYGSIYTAVGPTALVPVHDDPNVVAGSPSLFAPIKYFGLTSTSTALASHVIRRPKYLSSNPTGNALPQELTGGLSSIEVNPKPWVFRVKKFKITELVEPEGIRFFDTQLLTIDDPWKTLGFYEMGCRFWEMEYPQIAQIVPQPVWAAYAQDWGSLRVTAASAVEMKMWRASNTDSATAADTQGKMYRWAPLTNAANMINGIFGRPNGNLSIILGWLSYEHGDGHGSFRVQTGPWTATTGRHTPSAANNGPYLGYGADPEFHRAVSLYSWQTRVYYC